VVTNQDQAARGGRAGLLQHLALHPARPQEPRQAQQLKADFEAYLDGFSPNVQEILENFEFRNQIPRLSKADALGTLIEKLLDPDINLSPNPVLNGDGTIKHPGLDNHAWARSSRSWCAASTRRTTRKPASTGRRATP
jgi:type I restriction enzyme M protein